MSEEPVDITVELGHEGEDVEDRAALIADLQQNLAATDGVSLPSFREVRFSAEGRRGQEAVISAVAAVLSSAAFIRPVAKTIQVWLTERNRQSVTVRVGGDTLEIHGRSTPDAEHALEAFVRATTERRGRRPKGGRK